LDTISRIVEGLYAGPGCIDLGELGIHVDIIVSLDPSCPVTDGGKRRVYPIENLGIEPLINVWKSLDTLYKEHFLKHRTVYVHCYAGCGRTGSIVIAYLVLFHEYSLEDAINLYYSRRLCGPESWEQHKFLDVTWRLKEKGLSGTEILEIIKESEDLGEYISRLYTVDTNF
jgi:hypothetical protein